MSSNPLEAIAQVTGREQLLTRSRAGYGGRVGPVPNKLAAIEAAAAAFQEAHTSYALIGGVAVGIRSGVPRATLDVDFAIPTRADREATLSALRARGFRQTGVFAHSINLVHSSGEPVQLAFDLEFDPMIGRAEQVRFEALALFVVTREDLLSMKRRAAADPARRRSKALQDQADIALLEGDVPQSNEGW